jgi:hypothetical protein
MVSLATDGGNPAMLEMNQACQPPAWPTLVVSGRPIDSLMKRAAVSTP